MILNEIEAKTEYMSNFVLKVLRLKPEKWQKMLQSDDRVIFKKNAVKIKNYFLTIFFFLEYDQSISRKLQFTRYNV